MPVSKPEQSRAGAHSPLMITLKLLLLVATLVSGVVAGLQLTGRMLLSFADELTPRVNAALQSYRVELRDLSGDWRGFNPIVRVGQVRFAAGDLQQLEVEIDFFRSLIGEDLVFARAQVKDGQIGLIHTPTGWQLKGAQEQPLDVDFANLVQNTQSVDAVIGLTLERGLVAAGYNVVLKRSHRAKNLHTLFSVSNSSSQTDTFSIAASTRQFDDGEGDEPPITELEFMGKLFVAPGLLGPFGLALAVSEGTWFEGQSGAGTLGRGQASARLSLIKSALVKPGVVPTLQATVELQRLDQNFIGQIQSSATAGDQDTLALPDARFLVNANELLSVFDDASVLSDLFVSEDLLAKVALADAALEPITEFGSIVLAPETILGEWVAGLNVRGDLHNLVAFYDRRQGFGFSGQGTQLRLSPYRGSPGIRGAAADVFGDFQQIGMNVAGENVTMDFPTVFADAWFFEEVQGQLTLLFRPGYASIRGENIEAYAGISRITGGFATSRPTTREEQRVSLGIEIDLIQTESTRPFIPKKLDSGLRRWLEQAPQTGDLLNTSVAHHGQIHVLPGSLGRRRFEMTTNFQNAAVKFAEDWPALNNGAGSLHIAGPTTFAEIDAGEIEDVDIAGAKLRVEAVQPAVFLDLASVIAAQDLLHLIRVSPLQQSLSFISPQWTAAGDIRYSAAIAVPLRQTPAGTRDLQVDLTASFDDLDLTVPEYRLAWRELSGEQSFSLPHNLQGPVSGKLFGETLDVDVSHDFDSVRFRFNGKFSADDVFYLAGLEPSPVISGSDQLQGELRFAINDGSASQLEVTTDLRGFVIDLPAQFGKPLGKTRPSNLLLTFGAQQQLLDWRYGKTQGRLLVPGAVMPDGFIGSIGLNAEAPALDADYEGLVISGTMGRADLADWVSVGGDPVLQTPFNWQIRELNVDELVVDELMFTGVTVNAASAPDALIFQLQSEDIAGSVDLADPKKPQFDLLKLRLPAPPTSTEGLFGNLDPIDVSTGYALPRAQVFIDQLYLGEKAFGRWKFDIVPEQDAVRFEIDNVMVNGVGVTQSILRWDLRQNVSAFSGSADIDDLATTLPLWGYAPVVTTSTASVEGNLSWVGSPANIDFSDSEGSLALAATEGRFLDVETPGPGLRAVSLFNITALTKRISFDFSDVIGEGISFEKTSATIQLEDKKLTFTDNLIIRSTSSRYELGGEVDLRTDELDAQMIVTLPVSDSLPWYAAYLAIVNPVAGIGLAVGERVFRKPIERMSSAKFAISGGLSDPQVVFTDLFNQDIAVADEVGERLSPDLLKTQTAESQD